MSVVGIDLGNETSIVAVARSRGIDVVLNAESNRETPAVVSFTDKQRHIGTAAAITNPRNTISQIKRLIGRRFNDPEVQIELATLPFTVTADEKNFLLIHVEYLNEERTFTPTQILAMILSDLKRMAGENLSTPVVDCCIGIPVFYTDLQRRAVLNAAEIAGLHPLCLVHETTATALGYGIYKTDLSDVNVAFVDIGHASMQVCVVNFSDGGMKVLGIGYDRSLGGRDFDEVLFKYFAAKFKKEYKIDVGENARASLRLRVACEKVKKVLSANPEAPLNIECLMEEKDVRGFIKRELFEEISGAILERVKVPLKTALVEAGLRVKDIHSVEVVGSGSRVPAIGRLLTEFFKKEPRRTLNASECVARGCVLQCATLSPTFQVKEFQVHERFPFTIALLWRDCILASQKGAADNEGGSIVFRLGDPIPITEFLTFYSCSTFLIDVVYTDMRDLHVQSKISAYQIGPFQSSKDAGYKFVVKVSLNIHGIVSIESAIMLEEELEVLVLEPSEGSPKTQTDEEVMDCTSQGSIDNPDAYGTTCPSCSQSENAPRPEDSHMEMEAVQVDGKTKAHKKVKKTNVPVAEHVYGGMTSADVLRAVEVELEMSRQDRVMEETKDMKNSVEALVYDMRNKLRGKYHDFVTPEERTVLSAKLQEVEDWLYEDGEDETKEVYVAKVTELKKHDDPVEQRYKEFTDREHSIQQLFHWIQSFSNMVYSRDARFSHITIEEKEKVLEACTKAQMWLDMKIEEQKPLPKYMDPVLHAANVRSGTEHLYKFCWSIMSKSPQFKQRTSVPTERRRQESENSAQQPDNGNGSGEPSNHESEVATDFIETDNPKAERVISPEPRKD